MSGDSLGDRIKRYEEAGKHRFAPRQPLLVRVDGRAFHTYTRRLDRPFDHDLMDAMEHAMRKVAADMQGFKLAYTQSDECTFLLTDFDRPETRGWFNYELNKVVSLSASLFTAHFDRWWSVHEDRERALNGPAAFDARAFTVLVEDVPNVFVWRQRDWERNSVAMLAQAHFSHKQLHGKKVPDMHEMLHGVGVNWARLSPREKNGTFLLRDGTTISEKADYAKVHGWVWSADEEATA